ncbi:DUF4231 domain-containing protein [Mycoplasmopsis iners]|uniref:DUF4231 domain-containing protein n=1 Tax=Mycoplasmopsis iners TaxID=76630 RepID=UPI000495E88A|nr:DUF4231 domain-containing protein [Mycoplasmopsis iners]
MWYYGIAYYTLNFLILFSALFTGIIGTLFLAGNSNYLNPNPYKTWINADSNYIITLTMVNSIVTLLTGVLSFFVVNIKFQQRKEQLNKLKFEYILYKSKQAYYSVDKVEQNHMYIFYKRILAIMQFDRYRRDNYSMLKDELINEKGKKNGNKKKEN